MKEIFSTRRFSQLSTLTSFVSAKRVGKDTNWQHVPVQKIEDDAKATYQSIQDMIKRYTMIIQKIAESNATTKITVDGKELTVSAAISLIKDINDKSFFEEILCTKLKKDYSYITQVVEKNNNTAEANKQTLLNNLISRNSDKKVASEEDINLVNATIEKDYMEFVDPIGIADKIKELEEYTSDMKSKLLSAIKVSNATTTIEID